jgi:DNA replication protein DnaC
MTLQRKGATEMTTERICNKHGSYDAHEIVMFEGLTPHLSACPQCVTEHDARRALQAEQDAQRQRSEKLKGLQTRSSIPPRFADVVLSEYEATARGQKYALTVCQAFVDTFPEQWDKGRSLLFTGKCGTGKTHLACAIGNLIMAQYLASVKFGTASELLRSIKETYRKGSLKSEQQTLGDLLGADLLIIDEVGAQSGTAHELQLLFELFNGRYQDLKPTILISNLNPDELETFLGERIMDRFRECAAVLAFDWESHRGKKASA